MGILDRLRRIRERREDPDCPLNVARAKAYSLYGPAARTSVIITRDPNHPVCRKCTRRNWFNCGIEPPTSKTKSAEKKEIEEKNEETALKGLKTLFE